MKADQSDNQIARLSWACRRGMLELDVLLGNFLKDLYDHLDDEDKKSFRHLLTFPDPDLFAWLIHNKEPDDKTLTTIINAIRKHAREAI